MVSTRDKKTKRTKAKQATAIEQSSDRGAAATTVREGVAEPRRGRRQPAPQPPVVKSRDVAARIRALADGSSSLDVRRRLRGLARQVDRGPGNVQRMTLVENAVSACLDEAAAAAPPEQWLICEAAAWAVAWMARTRRAGSSAGGLLERLVRMGRGAVTALEARDTRPAHFVLALARLFVDIEACRCLEQPAATSLAEEILRLASPAGAVRLSGSGQVVERVVRWTACRDVSLATGGLPWSDEVESLWAAAAGFALRLLGGHGRMLAGAGRLPGHQTAALVEALLGKGRHRVSKATRRTARTLVTAGPGAQAGLLDRDFHDPASAVAVIRTGWGRKAIRILVEYRDTVPRLEIAVDDRLLVDGAWEWAVSAGGRPLDVEGAWSVSCWETDRKATFLELTAPLGGGLQFERQVVVLPADRIVLLADAVTIRTQPDGHSNGAAPADPLEYEGGIALAASLETEPAAETREVIVFDTAKRCMVLPLALPEWRVAGYGGLTPQPDGRLVLTQRGHRRLSAPLWLDLDPARVGGPLTWRQLTVADTRQNLPPHQAVGFRVQAGLEQWLVYRALDVARNRTLLGCNVSCEFLLGRLKRSGEVARTLEIQ
ncbi:MAG: hypothetical protein RLZZ21_1666 [Planctomycetota bacterium]|jgi:hypothetical protein